MEKDDSVVVLGDLNAYTQLQAAEEAGIEGT